MKKSDSPVIVEETFNVLPEEAWKAITNIDEMR